MATIVYLPGVNPISGSRRATTFDVNQAGHIAKRRPSPVNNQTNLRMQVRSYLKATNAYYWNLPDGVKVAWRNWGLTNGIDGPYGRISFQLGCAAFFSCELNARLAGDPFYNWPPGNIPMPGVTFTNLTRVDNNTIRATFIPSPSGLMNRIYLRQARPGPGVRRWSHYDGFIAEHSAANVTSPYDFTTHFQHLAGWHGRYWTGTQETTGRRSIEDLWDL